MAKKSQAKDKKVTFASVGECQYCRSPLLWMRVAKHGMKKVCQANGHIN